MYSQAAVANEHIPDDLQHS